MDTFQVHILAADRTFYEGPCLSLTIPTGDGQRGILAHHSNMMVDAAEHPEEIDAARARREADEAREALLQKRSRQEYQLAQASLARALNRLRVKGMRN